MKNILLSFIFYLLCQFCIAQEPIYNNNDLLPFNTAITTLDSNGLFIGIENPVEIIIPGYKNEDITVSGCNVRHVNKSGYIAMPDKAGYDSLTIIIDSEYGPFTFHYLFRVFRISDPFIYYGTSRGGNISISEFRSVKELEIKTSVNTQLLAFNIISFEMVYTPQNGPVRSVFSSNEKFTKQILQLINKAAPGDKYTFIASAQFPDGRKFEINTSYTIVD